MENIKYLLEPKEFERFKYFKEKNEKEMNPNNKFCHRYLEFNVDLIAGNC
jgi:hypothetical protein